MRKELNVHVKYIDVAHVVIAAIIVVVVLFECKYGKPIAFIFGKPKIFEGTRK